MRVAATLIAAMMIACSGKGARDASPEKLPESSGPARPPAPPVTDSLARLEGVFQQERAAINAEAAALDSAPAAARFAAAYAARFDSLRARTIRAESLRARLKRYRVKLKENS